MLQVEVSGVGAVNMVVRVYIILVVLLISVIEYAYYMTLQVVL